jgi:hypothetical protein
VLMFEVRTRNVIEANVIRTLFTRLPVIGCSCKELDSAFIATPYPIYKPVVVSYPTVMQTHR